MNKQPHNLEFRLTISEAALVELKNRRDVCDDEVSNGSDDEWYDEGLHGLNQILKNSDGRNLMIRGRSEARVFCEQMEDAAEVLFDYEPGSRKESHGGVAAKAVARGIMRNIESVIEAFELKKDER